MPITPVVASVANRCLTMSFQTLANFAQASHDAILANAATFTAPPVTMANYQTHITTYQVAVTAWGTVGHRGSHAQYVAVKAARLVVLNDTQALANYVEQVARTLFPGNVANQDATIILAAMRVKNYSNRLAVWGPVNNFRQLIMPTMLGTGNVVLRWNKPNVVPGAMSKPPAYVVQMKANLADPWSYEATTSSTSFMVNIGTGNAQYFQVYPVSAAGNGGVSPTLHCFGQ